jgi:ABC-2 type transport system permease protein
MAGLTIGLLYIAGASIGVSMPAKYWLEMTGLMLVALIPFAALGIMLGHLINVDSLGPTTGGLVSLLAFLGGTWFPLTHGFLRDLGQLLPSYWLVQASHVALAGHGWNARGWITIAVWSVALGVLARWAFQRDTKRVA